jgi:hypothetical protein
MAETERNVLDSARERVREFFLLDQKERAIKARSPSQQQVIRTYHDAASRRLSVASDLRGPTQSPAALALYRQGALFLVLGNLAARERDLDPSSLTTEEAFRRFDDALAIDHCQPPFDYVRAKPLLLSSDSLELDRLSEDEAGRRIEELNVATDWLAGLVDPSSLAEIKIRRVGRIVGVSVCLIAALIWTGVRLFAPKSIAQGKPVQASSVYGPSAPATAAVDGETNGTFGFHSALEDSPWLSVDLGQNYEITKIKILGRGDSDFNQSVPLALAISDDGTEYREIARRAEAFSESDPWIVTPPPPISARFIRLQTMRRTYLVLGEVQVFGKPPKGQQPSK